MKNNILKMILFFSLFLTMFSFEVHADLILSNNFTSPSGSVSYSSNQPYQFNITLQNTSFPVDTVYFEWNGANVTPTGNRTIDANTTEFYMNIVNLPANETGWSYKWFVSDTGGETNYTQNVYVINKYGTVINLFLDGNDSNNTYNLNNVANFIASLNVPGKNIALNSNILGFSSSPGATPLTTITNLNNSGLFYINASFGGDQNYSSNSITHYVNVTPWSRSVTSPLSPVSYLPNQNYQFNVTWQSTTPINNVYFEWNGANVTPTGNRTIDANTTEFYLNEKDLAVNTYSYNLIVNDTNGNIISSEPWNYIITQKPVTLFWTLPDSSSLWTVNTGTTTTVTCNAGDSINLTLNINSGTHIVYSSSLGSVSDSPSSSTVAIYTYNCLPTDTVNYSANIQGTLTFQVSSNNQQGGQNNNQQTSFGNFSINGLTPLSMNQGESKPITFTLSNTLDAGTLTNVTVSLTDLDSSWYSLSSTKIPYLYKSKPQTITLTLNIPASADAKTYDITVTAKGTVIGSTLVRTATSNMELTVNNSNQNVIAPLGTGNENTTSNETQNTTTGEQFVGPTGLVSVFEYMRNNLLIVVAIAACVLIFIFRDDVNEDLMRITGRKGYKKYYKTVDFSSLKDKLPDFEKIKNGVRDLRPEKPGIKRPEVLEREIKRDIRELENIIDNEKKLDKKKKPDVENN